MKTPHLAAALIIMLFFVSACGPSEADLAETEMVNKSTSQAQSTNMMSEKQTAEFATQEHQTQVVSTANASTSQASTATMAFEETQQQNAEDTQVAKTQQANTLATEKASDIFSVIQALYDNGHISRTAGSFQQLPNYSDHWKAIAKTQNHIIEDSFVNDFVLVLNVSWDSVTKPEKLNGTGCGISFRVAENSSEYYTFSLALDGTLRFIPNTKAAKPEDRSSTYWGDLTLAENNETFIITVEGTTFQMFNEQLEMVDIRYHEELSSGYLAYYLMSTLDETDTSEGCFFSKLKLWRLED